MFCCHCCHWNCLSFHFFILAVTSNVSFPFLPWIQLLLDVFIVLQGLLYSLSFFLFLWLQCLHLSKKDKDVEFLFPKWIPTGVVWKEKASDIQREESIYLWNRFPFSVVSKVSISQGSHHENCLQRLYKRIMQDSNSIFGAWKKIDLLSLNSLFASKDTTRIRLKQWPTSFVEESLSWSLSFRDWVTQRDSFMFHTDFHFSCDCVGNKFCCRFLWQQLQSNTCRNAIVSFLSHSIFFFVVCDEDSREFHLVPSSILESLLVSWCSVQLELFSLLPSSYTCDVVSCLSCLSSLCVNRRLFAPTNSLITSRSLLTREQFSLMFVVDSDSL